MAQKIIKGDNLLNSIDDEWSGINTGNEPITVHGTVVKPGVEWGMNKGETERIIKEEFKKRVGCMKTVQNEQNANVMLGFRNNADWETWNSLPDGDKWGETGLALIVSQTPLPSEAGNTYTVLMSLQSSPAEIQPSNNVTLHVKGASSVLYAAGGSEDITENLTVEIQSRTNPASPWIRHDSLVITANASEFSEVSLKDYLYDGVNYVRIRAVGEYASSVWRSFTLNVVNLSLTPNTAFSQPVTGDSLQLNYLVAGSVAKTLQFEFGTGHGSLFVPLFSYLNNDAGCSRNLGTSTNTSTGLTFEFSDATMLESLLADGVHTVRARLYVSESVKTEWIESQFMVVKNTPSVPRVVVNDIQSGLANWSDVRFFSWAAFTGGLESLGVVFRLTDEDNINTLASWQFSAEPNTEYLFSGLLGIDLADNSVAEFYGYIHIEDTEGNELASPVFFRFDNSADNQPSSGAVFRMIPSVRSNSEEHPDTIINSVDGQAVGATFSGFGFKTDGWVNVNKDADSVDANAEKVRALFIPAGRSVDIDFNPFSQLTDGNNTGRHMTFEIDFRTNNILDEDEPVLVIGSQHPVDGNIWGFEMLPLEARLLTQRMRATDDQNVSWAEGVRTHLSVNIVFGLQGLNYVRILLDGKIEREFNYAAQDRFTEPDVHIVIGNTSSDISIFGMSCYTRALATAECMQNFKASMSSVAEKLAFAEANDILGDNDDISFTKVLGKYNLIGHTGHLPKYGDENKGKTSGVSIYVNIVGDPTHSGTLTELESSGQGTTAMTYRDWNQQYKVTDGSVFTPDEGEAGEAGAGYAIQNGEYLAKKLVGKINFASCMQSHKLGLTWIYNDLFKRLMHNNVISQPSQMELTPNSRIAVFEKPFFFFHRETVNDPWEFKYLMTFGAGKGDKPTFGFNKNTTPNYLMVEGANNDRPLALFRIPWNDDISYSPDDEAWMFNGQKQLNFGFGKTSVVNGKEYPASQDAVNALKDFFNFAYLHHSRVSYFNGTLTQLKQSMEVSASKFYWVTQDDPNLNSYRFDLYRFDDITMDWVDAGVNKISAGNYEKLNMRAQYESFCSQLGVSPQSWTDGQWSVINGIIVANRRAHFKATAASYIHIDDALYHSCFIKLYAGTDNRAKNTYYYVDPVTLKIRFIQDDLDTTIKTNNVGQNRKPYYVEEHDVNAAGDFYWQGEESGFFNLLEEAFENEMSTMMFNMMTGMAELAGSVMAFHERYFLSTQDYFPAIAYNEQARLVYEAAAVAQAAGSYKNDSVQAITQSCGSQRWSEYQWLKDRIMYISSWCEYGEFAGSSSAPNGMSWRGKNGAVYNFKLTPAKWLYPRVGSDSGNYPASASGKRVRVPAGQQLIYPSIRLSSDSWIAVRGIDYMLDIGDMNIGLSSEQGTFSLSGKRLQRIAINEEGTDENQFLATSIVISNAVNIKELIIRNVGTVSGAFDLSKCTRMESLDLRDTPFSIVELPDSENLVEAKMPSSLAELVLSAQPNLADLSFEGFDNLQRLELTGCPAVNSRSVVFDCFSAQRAMTTPPLRTLRLPRVEWEFASTAMILWMATLNSVEVTGSIEATNGTFSLQDILALNEKFGDITNPDGSLYITYRLTSITSVGISGPKFITSTGATQWGFTSTDGNNIAFVGGKPAISWQFVKSVDGQEVVDNDVNSYIELLDSRSGRATVKRLNEAGDETRFLLKLTAQLKNGSTMTAYKRIGLFRRIPRRGDLAFHDGTFDSYPDPALKVVGYVIRRTPKYGDDGETVVAYDLDIFGNENAVLKSSDGAMNTASHVWGVFLDNNGTNGFPSSFIVEVAEKAGVNSIATVPMSNKNTSDYNTEEDNSNIMTIAQRIITRWLREVWDNTDLSSYEDMPAYTPAVASLLSWAKSKAGALPATPTELADMMLALQRKMSLDGVSSVARYNQLFFPAAYACNIYQPQVAEGETLDAHYTRGQWRLPACALLLIVAQMFHASRNKVNNAVPSATYANEDDTVANADYPLFANLLKRYADAGLSNLDILMPSNTFYWSATENINNSTNSWNVDFSGSSVNTGNKLYGYAVRPVAAFTFYI